MMSYDIHDNHNVPFVVTVNDGMLQVIQDEVIKLSVNYTRVWIPSDVDPGNSILAQIDDRYLYIGSEIFTFRSLSPIVDFQSEIGNNDVPYPHAVDDAGRWYMMLEDVVVVPKQPWASQMDAYTYYYNACLITIAAESERNPLLEQFRNIEAFMIGNKRYTLTYHANPIKMYQNTLELGVMRLVIDNQVIDLTQEIYVEMNDAFGEEMGFQPFAKTVICERGGTEFVDL